MGNILKEHFARRLMALYDKFDERNFSVEDYNEIIMKAFIDYASETPDNKNCKEHIEFGSKQNSNNEYIINYGFKLQDKPISLVDVLHKIEGIEIPEPISNSYPDLTSEEWDALMRMTVIIVSAFSPTKRIT